MNRLLWLITIIFLTGCAVATRPPIPAGTVPEGRAVTNQDQQRGEQVRQALLQQFKEDRNPENFTRISRVVSKLAHAAGGNAAKATWRLTVLADDNIKNAAATSGNYIFVWTGMLKMVRDDHELATILAHELSHVLALHTEPTFAEQIGSLIASGANLATQTALARAGVFGTGAATAGGLSSTLVKAAIVNPYSQKMELEADQIGLFLMARAGYNPQAAVNLWQRLAQDPDFTSNANLNFLSTHPSSNQRIEELKRDLPQAKLVYQQSRDDSFNFNKKNVIAATSQKNSTTPTSTSNTARNAQRTLSTQTTSSNNTSTTRKGSNYVSPLDRWHTTATASVYEAADSNSRKITELSADTDLVIIRELKEWLELKEPIAGFINKKSAKAAWSKR